MKKGKPVNKGEDWPLLYHKTREEIEAYRNKPVRYKLQWLEAQMEFFHCEFLRDLRIWDYTVFVGFSGSE